MRFQDLLAQRIWFLNELYPLQFAKVFEDRDCVFNKHVKHFNGTDGILLGIFTTSMHIAIAELSKTIGGLECSIA